jgi:hypothetical protein
MMLTGRNEWIAIGALILYIAFVPCPYWMKQFFASPIGKALALGAVIYAWKYVSCPVAILLLVAFLRSGAIREYLEPETGLTPPEAPTSATAANDYSCASGYTYVAEKMMCMKGNESKNPDCNDASMTWDSMVGKCVSKPTTSESPAADVSSGGPPGGTTPGAMAAKNEMANAASAPITPPKESFTPYGGKTTQEFAPL